jgi:hypothetical protein
LFLAICGQETPLTESAMSIDYNTAHVEPHRRFDYWKEVVCRHCIPAHSHPVEEITFDGQLQVRALGPVDLAPENWSS